MGQTSDAVRILHCTMRNPIHRSCRKPFFKWLDPSSTRIAQQGRRCGVLGTCWWLLWIRWMPSRLPLVAPPPRRIGVAMPQQRAGKRPGARVGAIARIDRHYGRRGRWGWNGRGSRLFPLQAICTQAVGGGGQIFTFAANILGRPGAIFRQTNFLDNDRVGRRFIAVGDPSLGIFGSVDHGFGVGIGHTQ